MSTKTSKHSNESSKKSLNRLWLVAGDPYVHEQLRLALDDTEWDLCALESATCLPPGECSGESVVIAPAAPVAEYPAAVDGLSPAVPLMLVGWPGFLEALKPIRFDDFLCEPWTGYELLYRLRRLAGANCVRCPGGTVAWGRYWVSGAVSSEPIRRSTLSPSQYAILDVLGRSLDEPVAREALSTVAGGAAANGRALDMHLSRLRSRLRAVTATWQTQPQIRAYRTAGYRFEPA